MAGNDSQNWAFLAAKGAILETHGLPGIFLTILGNHGQHIAVWWAPFRTLIADKNSPCSASFRHSSRRHDFYTEFGQPSSAISSQHRSRFGDTWIAQDFPRTSEKSRTIYHRLWGTMWRQDRTRLDRPGQQVELSSFGRVKLLAQERKS